MIITGFGADEVNGTYTQQGTLNGYPKYVKDDAFIVAYYPKYMPYRYDEAYYIIKVSRIYGSNTIETPKYVIAGTDPTATGWEPMGSWFSEETQIGTVEFVSSSSESSSSP